MTAEEKTTIKKLQSVLFKIDSKIPVFFNITQYQKMGVVKGINQYYKNSAGNKERLKTNWHLTQKGKQILNTIV